jgi:hypothetical protein
MKKLMLVVVFSALSLTSLTSYANCALAAVMNPPELPAFDASRTEDMPALKSQVERYLNRASEGLAVCEGYSDDFVYNAAVARLEKTADHYNALVRQHRLLQISAK